LRREQTQIGFFYKSDPAHVAICELY
jgi:hypothetical protein